MYDGNYPNDMNQQSEQSASPNGNMSNGGVHGVYSGYQTGSSIPQSNIPRQPKKKRGILGKILLAGAIGICFGLFAGVGFVAVNYSAQMLGVASIQKQDEAEAESGKEADEPKADQEISQPQVTTNNSTTTVTTDITNIVEKAMPSVVAITNSFTQTERDFFGQTYENQGQASGSGIIVGESDSEYLIVTNYHVIENEVALSVQFIDGESAQAMLKGYDSNKDLAVVAVPKEGLKSSTVDAIAVATLGDSDSLTVGEPAIAIGNAMGYGQSVTTGVISATNREIQTKNSNGESTSIGSDNKLIQTDAAINPGNSGGALLNIKGEVIGINSNKLGGTIVEGMGYAIPISDVQPIIEELMNKSTKEKVSDDKASYLGISGVNVTEEVSKKYDMPKGVYVAQVYEGTGAAAAGLTKGDIITKFDGSTVSSMEELQKMMQYYAYGDTVEVTIQQGSPAGYEEKTVTVTLGKKDTDSTQTPTSDKADSEEEKEEQ